MTTGSDRQAKNPPRRRAGNIYQRLEEARAKRAQVLATPKPANKPTPVETKVVPARVVPEKKSGRERLPTLAPASVDPVPEPVEDVQKPRAVKGRVKWLAWHAAIVVILLAALFALTRAPATTVTVSADTPATLVAPVTPDAQVVTPSFASAPTPQSLSALAAIKPDAPPTRPTAENASPPDVPTAASMTALAIPTERPRQNPRVDAEVARGLPSELQVSGLEADDFAAPVEERQLDLRPAVNLPRSISSDASRAVEAQMDQLGLDWGAPRYFNFNVNQTQVRYFHDTDKADASVLAEAFGATLRDFTGFQPLPPEGRVELWIAGRSSAQPRTESTNILGDVRRDLRQFGSGLQDTLRSITGNR